MLLSNVDIFSMRQMPSELTLHRFVVAAILFIPAAGDSILVSKLNQFTEAIPD